MKKWKLMLGVAIAGMLLTTWTAHADSETRVIIEGREVQFEKAPVVYQGTTLVPFRVLFEKLGLTVDWNGETKTITGRGYGITIQLQLGLKTAVVNGTKVEMAVTPSIIDGSAYVPLRLVGEATGRFVNWDHATRTITIGAPSVQTEVFDFEEFYRSFIAAINAEDTGSVRAMLHPESPIMAGWDSWIESFRIYDVVIELEDFELLETDESSAVLSTVEESVNINSLFYPDNRTEKRVHLQKDENGTWKIYDIERYVSEVQVPEEVLTRDAEIDKAIEQEILDFVAKYTRVMGSENYVAAISMIDPASPDLEFARQSMEGVFHQFDLDYELDYRNVIQVTDTRAFVYMVTTVKMKRIGASETPMVSRSGGVMHLRKQADGSWKIYETYRTEPPE